MKLDPAFVSKQIFDLLAAHPELEEDDVLRADMIEGSTDTHEFLRAIVRKIGSAELIANGTIEYIGELQERKARLERRQFALRQLAFKVMDAGGLGGKGHPVELPEATLSIRQGVQKVMIINEHEIPKEFLRVKTEPDKTKIKAAMQAHEYVPGCALSNAETILHMRVK